jgi:hypothetical protein
MDDVGTALSRDYRAVSTPASSDRRVALAHNKNKGKTA